jgi:hypothetical protein
MVDGERKLPEGERIDFVTIVTPNVAHFEIATAFIEAGLPRRLRQADDDDARRCGSAVPPREEARHGLRAHAQLHRLPDGEAGARARAPGHAREIRKIVAEYPQGWLAGATGISMWRLDPKVAGSPPPSATSGSMRGISRATSAGWRSSRSAPTSRRSARATSSRTTRTSSCTIRAARAASSTRRRCRWARRTAARPHLRHQGGARLEAGEPELPRSPVRERAVAHLQARQRLPRSDREAQLAAAVRASRGIHRGVREHLPQLRAHHRGAALRRQARRVRRGLPTVQDGARGVHFIHKAIESGKKKGWVDAKYTPPGA